MSFVKIVPQSKLESFYLLTQTYDFLRGLNPKQYKRVILFYKCKVSMLHLQSDVSTFTATLPDSNIEIKLDNGKEKTISFNSILQSLNGLCLKYTVVIIVNTWERRKFDILNNTKISIVSHDFFQQNIGKISQF